MTKPLLHPIERHTRGDSRYAKPVVTPILPARRFYRAEDYHQDYHDRNTFSYRLYRYLSGRDEYLESVWDSELDLDFSRFSEAGD